MAQLALPAIAIVFLVPALVMWLWNLTMPDVFQLREVTYWQAFRLFFLAAFFFGGAHAAWSIP